MASRIWDTIVGFSGVEVTPLPPAPAQGRRISPFLSFCTGVFFSCPFLVIILFSLAALVGLPAAAALLTGYEMKSVLLRC